MLLRVSVTVVYFMIHHMARSSSSRIDSYVYELAPSTHEKKDVYLRARKAKKYLESSLFDLEFAPVYLSTIPKLRPCSGYLRSAYAAIQFVPEGGPAHFTIVVAV